MKISPRRIVAAVVVAAVTRAALSSPPPTTVDVPLRLWTSPNCPNGLDFGLANGISFGDADHDGWVDLFSACDRKLWRNIGGADWQKDGNLDQLISGATDNGCFADFDNDGLPDLGDEPRGGTMSLLRNLA